MGGGWAGHGISEVDSQETPVTPRGQEQARSVATSGIPQTFTVFMGHPLLSQFTTVARPHAHMDLW